MAKSFFLFVLIFIILNISQTYAASDLEKAISLYNEQKYDDARTLLENVLDKNDTSVIAYFYLGRTLMMLKEFDDASDNFEEAVELAGTNADYHFWLAQAYAQDALESNIISKAFLAPKIKAEFTKTVELNPTHIGGLTGVANFHLNAPGIMGGDIEEAYKAGYKLLPLDELRGRLVLLNYFLKKELNDSINTQLKIVEEKFGSDPSIARFYHKYGYTLLENTKYDDAINCFKKWLSLNLIMQIHTIV